VRPYPINSLQRGIDRTRTKGWARPDTMFDAINCWVTVGRSARPRPGSAGDARLPAGTIGLTTFHGKLVVFADHAVDLSAFPKYELEILTFPGTAGPTLAAIHFAQPFLGFLYVIAEWSDGSVYHYWLREPSIWQANTIYRFGDLVQPTVPNGFVYEATRLLPADPVWTPDSAVQIGDRREPTVPNSFTYEVIDTIGLNPRTSMTEPDWPTQPDAIINEDADFDATVPPPGSGTSNTTPPSSVTDRYGSGPDAPTSGRNEQVP
jgi:hypothetical protein